MKVRQPAVAGRFYPGTPEEIIGQLDQVLEKERQHIDTGLAEKKIIGAVVPHAGYMFSAYQAVHFFRLLSLSKEQFDVFIIINPNHTGYGPDIALDSHDQWKTPLGSVPVDRAFSDLLGLPVSDQAHNFEHSGEVMLPLLQRFLDYDFSILPVSFFRQSVENAILLAGKISDVQKALGRKICLIASSDFSHYVHPDEGKKMDDPVVEKILAFETKSVFSEIKENQVSICGYGPIMTLMEYALRTPDDPEAKILRRGHSGDVMPSAEVVNYVTILFYSN